MEIPMITISQYNDIVADKEKCFLIFTKQKCSVCARLMPNMQKIEIHDPDARSLFKSWNLVGVPQTCIINDGEFQEALPGALDPNIYRDEINKLLGIQKKGFGAKLKSLFGGK